MPFSPLIGITIIVIICDYIIIEYVPVSLASFPRPPSPFLTFFLRAQKKFVYNIHTCKKKVRKGEGEPGNEATEAVLFPVTSFGENFSSKVYSTIIM